MSNLNDKKIYLETAIYLQMKRHQASFYNIMSQQGKDFKTCFLHDITHEIQLSMQALKNAYTEKELEIKLRYLCIANTHLTNLEVTYDSLTEIKSFNANLARKLLESLSPCIVQCQTWMMSINKKIEKVE